MTTDNLFRNEAVKAHSDLLLGQACGALSIKTSILVYLFTSLAMLAGVYCFWGTYTRRVTVTGFVQPAGDVLRLYPPQTGIVVQRHVQDGSAVRKGARLFTLTSERQSAYGPTQGRIADSILQRLQSYEQSVDEHRQLTHLQRQALARSLVLIEREIAQARQEQSLLQQRVASALQTRARFETLAQSGFVSPLQLQQKNEEWLDAARNLAVLARGLEALRREQSGLQSEIKALPLRQDAQVAELKRNADALKQDLAQNEVLRELHVTAPEDGIITSLTAQPGANAAPQQPLAMLVPGRSRMEVHLYAPSKAMGFVQSGARVKLRFEAFPFQKFGHADGQVIEVARTAMLPGELPALSNVSEPLYRIRVQLDKPSILAYGQEAPLLPSMRVEGDIFLETRRLYEWAFEPLYSVSGKW